MDFPVTDLECLRWDQSERVRVSSLWNGEPSTHDNAFYINFLWSETSFYIRFDARQSGALIISEKPQLDVKTMNLWERDVCEVFVAPNEMEPRKYFEFEIAPTGEWLDFKIDSTSGERVTDWSFESGMESAARIEEDRVLMAMKIPWSAFGRIPKAGDIWLGNIFRCVGLGEKRGYLAWQPTLTMKPNFHVPEKFGKFAFVK